jgi:hypothetical protein
MNLALQFACVIALALAAALAATGAESGPKRLLLLSQGPDGHPRGTHEYVAGQKVLAKCLAPVEGLEIVQVSAGDDWPAGGELAKADGAVLFLAEGAKWLNTNPKRREAFVEFAGRGGGLAVLHWGMGTRTSDHIEPFVALFGACHGGPDRKYKFLETQVYVATTGHLITKGLSDFKIKEEFYYELKQAPEAELVPLLSAEIDGQKPMVAWAWERPGGGRSFGYSGCHYHANWARPEYQRFISQGVLWTMKIEPPADNFPGPVTPADVMLDEK